MTLRWVPAVPIQVGLDNFCLAALDWRDMTLPSPSTAPDAIRSLALLLREGVLHARTARMKGLRKRYWSQLKKDYERRSSRFPPPDLSGGGIVVKAAPAKWTLDFPRPEHFELPPTWEARFYESLEYPVPRKFISFDRHPFRLSLEVRRRSWEFTIYIHDTRERWLGPTFKTTFRFLRFPMLPHWAVTTYIAFQDDLSDVELYRWLTVILSQRSMLSDEEEACAVGEFFVSGSRDDSEAEARSDAYRVLKSRFIQPIGGRPGFPEYYRKTLKMLRLQHTIETRSIRPLDVGDDISLKELRWSEPALHRAILDRIGHQRVEAVKRDNTLWVTREEAERIDLERIKNAEARQPKRFPGRRLQWINELERKGENRASATRKIKRWMNTLHLTEAEIEASIAKGRVVRLPSRRHPS